MYDQPFAHGDSVIHRIDPRHRIVGAMVFSFVVALCDGFPAILLGLFSALVLALIAQLNPAAVLRRLVVAFAFLLLLWLVLPFSVHGPPLIQIGPLSFSRAGIILSGRITSKVLTILISFTALLATMPLTTLGHALYFLKVSPKIVYLILMTYRYIGLLENEFRRSLRALKIRGFVPRTNLHTYKTFAYLIGMLLVRSVNRAERIESAMRCRGFAGRFYSLLVFPSSGGSWVFSGALHIAAITIAIFEWGPYWG